jgi:chromosome segregation ATPase
MKNQLIISDRALEVHRRIQVNGQLAAESLVEMCQALKEMRDERLYLEFGHAEFGEYTQKKFGIGQSQAYSYIQALERLGERALQANSGLGITKLKMLTELSAADRAELLDSGDARELSVRELKAAIEDIQEKYDQAVEQLSLFERQPEPDDAEKEALLAQLAEKDWALQAAREERDAALEAAARAEEEASQASADATEDEIEGRLTEALERERAKHKDEIGRAVDEARKIAHETDMELRQKALDEAKETAEREREQDVEIAKKEATEDLRRELERADSEKAAALERLQAMEKSAKVAADPNTLRFKFYFDELQGTLEKMQEVLGEVADAAAVGKMKTAWRAVLARWMEGLEVKSE